MNKEYNNQIDSDMQVRKYDSKFVRYESLTLPTEDSLHLIEGLAVQPKMEKFLSCSLVHLSLCHPFNDMSNLLHLYEETGEEANDSITCDSMCLEVTCEGVTSRSKALIYTLSCIPNRLTSGLWRLEKSNFSVILC